MRELYVRIGKVRRNVRLFGITRSDYVIVHTKETLPVAPVLLRPVTVTVVVPRVVAAPVTWPSGPSEIPAGRPVAVNVRPVPREKLTGRPTGLLIPCGLAKATGSAPMSWAGTDRLPVNGTLRDELPIMI